MSTEIRPAFAADLPAAAALADMVFRAGRPVMSEEFPLLFNPQNAENCLVALVDGKLVAHFGVARFILHIDGADVPAACVGAVCTHPDFRGQGLAGAAMDMAVAAAVKRGDVLMPISGGLPLYRHRHAYPVGPWWSLSVPDDHLPKPVGRAFKPTDFDAVAALRATNAVRYHWPKPVEAMTVLKRLESFGGTAWVRIAHAGTADAFALLRHGRPMHQDGKSITLLEWAGNVDGVLELCAAAAKQAGCATLKMRCPWQSEELLGRLRHLAVEAVATLPGNFTLKVLNLSRLLELFARRLHPLKPETSGENLVLHAPNGLWELRDQRTIHAILFLKRELWPETVSLSGLMGRELEPLLPLPIPDYGLCYT